MTDDVPIRPMWLYYLHQIPYTIESRIMSLVPTTPLAGALSREHVSMVDRFTLVWLTGGELPAKISDSDQVMLRYYFAQAIAQQQFTEGDVDSLKAVLEAIPPPMGGAELEDLHDTPWKQFLGETIIWLASIFDEAPELPEDGKDTKAKIAVNLESVIVTLGHHHRTGTLEGLGLRVLLNVKALALKGTTHTQDTVRDAATELLTMVDAAVNAGLAPPPVCNPPSFTMEDVEAPRND